MNETILLMHALKETCALHCLLALRLAEPLPVTEQVVMDTTGFDDKAVHKGLEKLLALGLVSRTAEPHPTRWQLVPDALTWLVPIGFTPDQPADVPAPALDRAAQAPGAGCIAETAPAAVDATPPSAGDITEATHLVDAPPETPAASTPGPTTHPQAPVVEPAPIPVNVESVPYYHHHYYYYDDDIDSDINDSVMATGAGVRARAREREPSAHRDRANRRAESVSRIPVAPTCRRIRRFLAPAGSAIRAGDDAAQAPPGNDQLSRAPPRSAEAALGKLARFGYDGAHGPGVISQLVLTPSNNGAPTCRC